jgi:hypothetical protein
MTKPKVVRTSGRSEKSKSCSVRKSVTLSKPFEFSTAKSIETPEGTIETSGQAPGKSNLTSQVPTSEEAADAFDLN